MSSDVSSPCLFLGFIVDQPFTERIAKASPAAVALITQGGDAYLESFVINNKKYLGKRLGALSDLGALESTEKNIQSLIERMSPTDHTGMPPLVILALPS